MIIALCSATPVAAQSGNIGGTIGKKNRSVSGERPAPAPRAKPRKAVASTGQTKSKRCPNITGAWDSWATSLFGKGDAVFKSDGTAMHRSGIPGKWFCRDGQLHIEWSDGKPGAVQVSADGKKILTSAGTVHASRD